MSQAIIMTFINITKFALINCLEKDHSMIERRCLKNVIFIQTVLSFVLPRKIINISSTTNKIFKPSYRTDSYRKSPITIGNPQSVIGQFTLFWYCYILQNSGAKYVGNKTLGQIQILSVCLGNVSAKNCQQLRKTNCISRWQWLQHTSAFCEEL